MIKKIDLKEKVQIFIIELETDIFLLQNPTKIFGES